MKYIKLITVLTTLCSTYLYATCNLNQETKSATIKTVTRTAADFSKKKQKRISITPTSFSSGWCTDEHLFTTAVANGDKVSLRLRSDDGRCGYQVRDIGTIPVGDKIERVENINFSYYTSGSGCWTRHASNVNIVNNGATANLYLGNISYCPGRSAQRPSVSITINSGTILTKPVCPDGYTPSGASCKKTISYQYKYYECDATDTNIQGYGWELDSPAQHDGSKIDIDLSVQNDLSGDLFSHDTAPSCTRQYQECTIECPYPLHPDFSTGKCYATYEEMCQNKNMVYNSDTNACETSNQCLYDDAIKDTNSSYCVLAPECRVEDGICKKDVIKECADGNFTYYPTNDKCNKQIDCLNSQYVLNKGVCGSNPICEDGDAQNDIECVHVENIQKSCAPDSREGNLCYVSGGNEKDVSEERPLLKTELSGGFHENEYGVLKNTLCSADPTQCQFRMTKIFADNNGKSLCFENKQGQVECVELDGNCKVSGSVEFNAGIRQMKVTGGNMIELYNLVEQNNSLGTIMSTCAVTGKVGAFKGEDIGGEIIAVKTGGPNIKFWDSYRRGFIGVISFLPTIPEKDLNEGFVYKDQETYSLMKKGFVGFYSENSDGILAVYDGFISKTECEALVNNTTYFIAQGSTDAEMDIMAGLNFKSGYNYNYNDGDFTNGSCIVKSLVQASLANQEFSIKKYSSGASSLFVCSPFKCENHYCQYNECVPNYQGDVYDQSYFIDVYTKDFPSATTDEACIEQRCDSNKPYFRMCGNKYGCDNKSNVYQQNDGTCVEVECRSDETLDLTTGKCVSYGCVNSVERDGKCYRSLY